MAGNEFHLVPEREELFPDRANEGRVVSPREIGAADGPLEEHIPHLQQLARPVEESHMPRRMPWAMQDFEFYLTKRHLVAIL